MKPKTASQLMGQLPPERVQPARPFLISGVDFCGPIYIRQGTRRTAKTIKTYVAVFVCFITRAVHLELVRDLTTAAFIDAFKRFVARRGKCLKIYSDNAKNFVGADRELQEMRRLFLSEDHKRRIQDAASEEDITWNWIAPQSPHQGGIWEAAVKQLKYHLRRVIGKNIYSYEQLNTLIIQVESCLNSRPLTPLSEDPDDICALTPGHFLIGDNLKAIPEPNLEIIPNSRLSMWQQMQKMFVSFWKRWSQQYLNTLQLRNKWHTKTPNILINQLVLISDKNAPPLTWQLGRIVKIHPGSDRLVRVVSIKTQKGEIVRSVQKIAPLPIET